MFSAATSTRIVLVALKLTISRKDWTPLPTLVRSTTSPVVVLINLMVLLSITSTV